MSVIRCKMCGGELEYRAGDTVGVCSYCKTRQTLPKLSDERTANLYDRASHYRRNNEYDKAAGIYEQILGEDPTDAETYWSLVLCRYGIEYVEDPATKRRIPTINRTQFTSVFDDDNYKQAIRYADEAQRQLYEEEAAQINEIQKGILQISQKEAPFDVFICYKETDQNGRRTPDSVLATDLYHQLQQEGLKTFFARITLEDKLGSAYEPYIFAALNSAKVMVVLGTKPEHFNAVWVKNEWSRYLALVKQSKGKKVLIPAYKDMDPYDLPEEFSHLQALDMGKLGFMQDLIRGIKKIAGADNQGAQSASSIGDARIRNIEPLLKRAFMFLEDGDFKQADEYCERVLDQAPENGTAYLGKLMAEMRVRKVQELADCTTGLERSGNYQKAVRFGNTDTVRKLQLYNTASKENERCDQIYNQAVALMQWGSIGGYSDAVNRFQNIVAWRDSKEKLAACRQNIEQIQAERRTKWQALERSRDAREQKLRRDKRTQVIAVLIIPILLAGIVIPDSFGLKDLVKKLAAILGVLLFVDIFFVINFTLTIIKGDKNRLAQSTLDLEEYREGIKKVEQRDSEEAGTD